MAVEVSMEYLSSLTSAINKVTGASREAARAVLQDLIATGAYETPMDLVQDALKALNPIFDQLTQMAASLSAQAYDVIRLAELGETLGAEPYQDRNPEWTEKALEGIAKHSTDMGAFVNSILDRLDYEAKRAAGSTMFQNGARDYKGKPRFARVPTGAETCPFCIMLASRGYVYYSSKTAGKLDHYHAHCDCRVVPSFGFGSIAGYDPDKYYEQYQDMLADGTLNRDALSQSAKNAHRKGRQSAKQKAEGARNYTKWQIRQALERGQRFTFSGNGPDGKTTDFVVPDNTEQVIPDDLRQNLGYTSANTDELFAEMIDRARDHSFARADDGSLTQNVRMRGANGEMARVLLTWDKTGDALTLKKMRYLKAGANH